MQLDGTFAVSSSGGATYHIPVAVPPGTAGMMPDLSLDYDSQRGSGIVGVGWSLNGFSAIRRCAQTVAQDNLDGRIGYDAADRFCLDGQRLMVVTGTYGADLAEYRTEVESFRKVISHGTAGTGPSWIEVRLPSGRVLEFGNTADSRILAKSKTSVRVWALNKITDTKGNYLTVTYNNDTTNGTYYPTRIDYTGNAAAALATYASVQFSYVARPVTDQVLAYTAASTVKLTQQLSEIKTFTGGAQVLSYKLAYEATANSATGVARLTSIQMCDAAALCQPATTFTWSNAPGGAATYGPWADWLTAPGTTATSKPVITSVGQFGVKTKKVVRGSTPGRDADIDGDGRSDVLINNNAVLSTSLSTGTGLTAVSATGITAYSPQLIDLFGTGREDIVALNASSQLVRYANNGAGGFDTTATVLISPGVGHPVFPDIYTPIFSDLNGDGLPDMAWHNSANVFKFSLNTGSGMAAAQTMTAPSNINGTICADHNACTNVLGTASIQFANVKGRGNTDLVIAFQSVIPRSCDIHDVCTGYTTSDNPGPWEVWYAAWNGTGFAAPVKIVSVALSTALQNCGTAQNQTPCPNVFPPVTTRVADVNGDGISDLYMSYPATITSVGNFPAGQFFYVGNGNGFGASVAPGFAGTSCGLNFVFRDIYTSGRTDAVCGSATAIRIARPNSAATAFVALAAHAAAPVSGDWWPRDFNGDGFSDFMVQSSTNHYWVALSNRVGGGPADLLTGIATGLGATTTISYDALSHDPTSSGQPLYIRGTAGTYPTIDQSQADYVVTKVDRSNGIGGLFSSGYKYAGAQFDLRGRGYLGLSKVTGTDLGTNVETATTYRLDYPFTGLIASDVKSLGPVVLANIANNFAATGLGGTRFLPLLTDSLAQGADLDGSALPSVTTTYQYDAFGNPTLVTATSSDGFGKTVSNTYTNDTTRWILGLLTQSQVTNSTP